MHDDATPPLDEARRELAMRYVPLALKIARTRCPKTSPLFDEARAVACLALVTAAARYDFGRGVDFCHYARRAIFGAVIDMCHAETRYVESLSAHPEPSEGYRTIRDATQGPERTHVERTADRDHLEHMLRWLRPDRRQLLRERYCEGQSIRDLCASHGVTKSTISTRAQGSLRKLRAMGSR